MRISTLVFGLAFAACVSAQPAAPPASGGSGTVRAVLGSIALANVVDAPRFYKVARIEVPADKASDYRGPLGFVLVLTGSLEVAAAAGRTMLAPGDGLSVGEGKTTFAAKGGKPALFLHFLLLRESELDAPLAAAPASVTELFRNTSPIPGLKPGPYEFTLVRVTIPGHSTLNAPHRRSGAAVYYVYAGTGTFVANGKEEIKPAGVVHFEPQTLVHQWGNARDAPLVLIQANISQEGVPAVIFMPGK